MEAALISATVALVLFIFTRWTEYRAKQSEHLRGKLEELVTSLAKISLAAQLPTNGTVERPIELMHLYAQRAEDLVETIVHPMMIARMYFPEAVPRLKEVARNLEAVRQRIAEYGDPTTPYDLSGYHELFGKLDSSIWDVREYIFDEQGSLTKRIIYTIFD